MWQGTYAYLQKEAQELIITVGLLLLLDNLIFRTALMFKNYECLSVCYSPSKLEDEF